MKNESFSKITQESAYWLGFIAADGCVQTRPTGQIYLKVVLAIRDIEHLFLLKQFLNCNNPIYKIGGKSPACGLRIGNKGMGEDLISLGIIPNKSKIHTDLLEHIPDNMKDYFIAGFFDGDGSIFTWIKFHPYKNKSYTYQRCTASITNNQKSLLAIIDHLKKHYNFHKLSIVKNGNVWRLRWDDIRDVLEFYKLYEKSPLHLKRKMIKYTIEAEKIKQKLKEIEENEPLDQQRFVFKTS